MHLTCSSQGLVFLVNLRSNVTNGGENSTGFWTLMSSGSWLGTGKEAIGDLPGDMNAWDKLQLGWLNYDTAKAGIKSWHKLGVAEYNTKYRQALVVNLPDKAVTTQVVTPAQGSTQSWSGSGNDLKNTLTRSVDLTGKSSATLTLDGYYDIEADYDYLYTEVSTDGGANWTALDGTVDGQAIPRDAGNTPALTGTVDGYKKLSYPLDAYAGKKIQLRFRYQTDGGVALKGFAADEITLTAGGTPSGGGSALFSDNARARTPLGPRTASPASARPSPRTTSSTTSPRTASTCRTTRPSRSARTTSAGPRPSRAGWSTSRTRTVY